MDYASAIIVAVGSTIAAILGAWALVVRARTDASKPHQLLQRLWDWVESTGMAEKVPPSLARAVQRTLNAEDRDEKTG